MDTSPVMGYHGRSTSRNEASLNVFVSDVHAFNIFLVLEF